MKRYLVSLLFVAGVFGFLSADSSKRGAPQSYSGETLQFADYGGYNASTGAFTTNMVTAAVVSGVVSEVFFSTGSNGGQDFVKLYDATSTINATEDRLIGQWYNMSATTFTNVGGTIGGSNGPKRPVRFKRGLLWKASTAVYNLITVYFNPDTEQ